MISSRNLVHVFVLSVMTAQMTLTLGNIERVSYSVDDNDIKIALIRAGADEESGDQAESFIIKNADSQFLSIEASKPEQIIGFQHDELNFERFHSQGQSPYEFVREINDQSFDYSAYEVDRVEFDITAMTESISTNRRPCVVVYLKSQEPAEVTVVEIEAEITVETLIVVGDPEAQQNIDPSVPHTTITITEEQETDLNEEENINQETQVGSQQFVKDDGSSVNVVAGHQATNGDRKASGTEHATKEITIENGNHIKTANETDDKSMEETQTASQDRKFLSIQDGDKTLLQTEDVDHNTKSTTEEEKTVSIEKEIDLDEENGFVEDETTRIKVRKITVDEEETVIHRRKAIKPNQAQPLI